MQRLVCNNTRSTKAYRPPTTYTLQSTMSCINQSIDEKNFDETKLGVRGLLNSGVTTLPPFFIHPQEILSDLKSTPPHGTTIPTIDLTGVDSNERSNIVEKISYAAREFGFFQLTNHGMPVELMKASLGAIKGFHEQSDEVKKRLYRRDRETGFSWYSNVDLFTAKAASWRDTIEMRLSPNGAELKEIPEIWRNTIFECDKEAKRVGEMLLELLCEGLGVEKDRLKEMSCSQARNMTGQYYPPCPQPDLTIGISSHKDPGVVTLLLQDEVGGLQVKYGGGWVDAKPVPGALLVNIGDILEILSNGEYKSSDHRVLANASNKPRVSLAIFLNPSEKEMLFGPLPELITADKPQVFRQFTLADYVQRYFSKDLTYKSTQEYYKL